MPSKAETVTLRACSNCYWSAYSNPLLDGTQCYNVRLTEGHTKFVNVSGCPACKHWKPRKADRALGEEV